MTTRRFGQAGQAHRRRDRFLQPVFVQVMPPPVTGSRVFRKAPGWEQVLPAPIPGGVRIFPFERERQVSFPVALLKVTRMEQFHPFGMGQEGRFEFLRQHGDPVLHSLAVADDDFVPVKIEILGPQPKGFHQAHAGAVKELGQQLIGSFHCLKDPLDFVPGQNDGQALRLAGADHVGKIVEFQVQDLLIKENEGIQRLVLGGAGHLMPVGEVAQERPDLRGPHFAWMPFLVKEDEPFDPPDVRFLGPQ